MARAATIAICAATAAGAGASRARARRPCSSELLPRRRPALSDPAAGRAGQLFAVAGRARCGSRSASAAASICSGRRAHNPDVGLIGCEPFEDGVVKVLGAIEEDKIANVRLHADDARAAAALAA